MHLKDLSVALVVVVALLACGDPEPGTGTLVLDEDVECPSPERVGQTGRFDYSGELVSIDGPAEKVKWGGHQRCCYDGVFDVGGAADSSHYSLETVCTEVYDTPDDGDVDQCPYISPGQLKSDHGWDDGELKIHDTVHAIQIDEIYLRDVTPRTWHCDYPITHIPSYDPY